MRDLFLILFGGTAMLGLGVAATRVRSLLYVLGALPASLVTLGALLILLPTPDLLLSALL